MNWRHLFARKPEPSIGGTGGVEDPIEEARRVLNAYHETTKHAPQRFARGPMDLDWDTQPDLFRRWSGADVIPLAHLPITDEPRYEQVFVEGLLAPRPL